MTPADKIALEMREAAWSATPDRWVFDSKTGKDEIFVERGNDKLTLAYVYYPLDCTHIAASSPANILAILDDRDRLLVELAEARRENKEQDRLLGMGVERELALMAMLEEVPRAETAAVDIGSHSTKETALADANQAVETLGLAFTNTLDATRRAMARIRAAQRGPVKDQS